jgi:hypothetical protein
MNREPISDYYDQKVKAECVYKSAGKFIYLDVESDFDHVEDVMVRLTPEQAIVLAAWLTEAAAE